MPLDTDLAVEAFGDCAGQTEGTHINSFYDEKADLKVTEIDIVTEETAKKLGKSVGKYITLESKEPLYEYSAFAEERCRAVADAVKKVCIRGKTLFVGLGNRQITPDSLGPAAADRVFATRHIKRLKSEIDSSDLSDVSVLCAGVLAQTGLESAETVLAVAQKTAPGQVIVCDALACSEPERMGRSIQISSVGVSPGSGVGNRRSEISAKTLGIPVASIGTPTVSRIMSGNSRFDDLIITPKPIDRLILRASEIIAGGLNMYFHPSLTRAEIDSIII